MPFYPPCKLEQVILSRIKTFSENLYRSFKTHNFFFCSKWTVIIKALNFTQVSVLGATHYANLCGLLILKDQSQVDSAFGQVFKE